MSEWRSRQLAVLAALAVAGAGLAALAAALTWWSADYLDPLTGALTVTVSGSACLPELIPLALVALAGLGASLATRGVLRRAVGVVLVLCGITIAVRSALALGAPPAALADSLSRPADQIGAAQLHPLGPVMAVLSGALLTTAGVLIAAGRGARRQLSSRYDAPGKASSTGRVPDAAAADPGDWWKALDAGADPTVSDPTVSDPMVDASPDPTVPDSTEPDSTEWAEIPAVSAADSGTVPNTTPESVDIHLPPVSDQTSPGGYHDPNATRAP